MYKKRESGQAAIIIALVMVALIAFVGLAIDAGQAYTAKREAQNAADAAALAATRQLVLECSLGGDGAVAGRIRNKADELIGTNNANKDTSEVYYTLKTADGFAPSAYQVTEGVDVPCGCAVGSAQGVEVVVNNPSQSFLAGVVGVDVLAARATGKARYAPVATVSDGLYPITRRYDAAMVLGQAVEIRVTDQTPSDAGNFGWLTWSGKWGANDLKAAMANGGYFGHPELGYCDVVDFGPPTVTDCSRAGGKSLSLGEWTQGRTGNVASLEGTLIDLMNANTVLTIPLYDDVQGQGSNFYYRVAGFGAFELEPIAGTNPPTPFKKGGNDKFINTMFRGYVVPGDWSQGCSSGGIQSVKLTP